MGALARTAVVLAMLASQALALDFSYIKDAAQDGDGTVWLAGAAKVSGQDVSSALFSQDGTTSRIVRCPEVTGAPSADSLTRLRNGEVLCLWSGYEPRALYLTRHRGDVGRLVSKIDLESKPLAPWNAFAPPIEDASGQIWFFQGTKLWRVTKDGSPAVAREFKETELNRPLEKDYTDANGFTLQEDGEGRIWLFGTPEYELERTLRTPTYFDGKVWHTPSGFPAGPHSSIIVRDRDHLWCAPVKGELFEFNLRTSAVTKVTEPLPGAFRQVKILRSVSGQVFASTALTGADEDEPPRSARIRTALWRFQEGKWDRVMEGLGDDLAQLDRLTVTEKGIVIPRSGGGYWSLTTGAKSAELIDWRRGVRVAEISRLIQTPQKKLLLIDSGGRGTGRLMQTLDEATPSPASRSRVSTFRLRVPMAQGADGTLWQIPLNGSNVLRWHAGDGWKDLPLPKEISAQKIARLAVDSLGRTWLFPDDTTQAAALFAPKESKWEIFNTLEIAYQSHLQLYPEFQVEADWLSPRYSKDGRIAFSHPRERLHYFDGKEWSSADGLLTMNGGRAVIRPFFNRAGRLAWNYHSTTGMVTQELHEKEGWQQARFEDNPKDPSWRSDDGPPLPRGAVSGKPRSQTQDRSGSTWFVMGHQLYRALPGVCIPIFKEGEPNPFVDNRSLDQAFIAPDCEIFLLTDRYDRGEYLHMKFDAPLPDTKARIATATGGSAEIDVESSIPQGAWFRWRLGSGNWSDPVQDRRISLQGLPSGETRCEIVALDQWLRADPTPAILKIANKIPEAARLSDLIGQLSSPDLDKREAAVRTLASHPETALPALKAARSTATEENIWWIDAALQEAERQRARK